MNILIDSGNCKNIGDNAMLENVLSYLIQHIQGEFHVIDKGVPLMIASSSKVKMVKDIKSLLGMPHWRILDYRKQPIICKQICSILFWIISVIRAQKIAIGVKLYKKFKTYSKNSSIKYWIELLSKMDAYWVVGGGNINDIWIESAFWKISFAWIFKIQGKPVIFSGQGIGPINRLLTKLIVQFGVKQISLLSLREKVSLDNLKRLSINLKNCYVVGDDALTISDRNGRIPSLPDKFVALNLRSSAYSFQEQKFLDKYARLVELLFEKYSQFQFIFIPIAFNKGDSDIESAWRIIEKIRNNKNRMSVLDKEITWENIKIILKHASFSMGVSYHFCLFSLAMGIPTVGLYTNDYYRQKLKGLMQMFNRKNGAFDLRNDSIEDLFCKIEQSYREFDTSQVSLAKKQMEHNWQNFMSLAVNKIHNGTEH